MHGKTVIVTGANSGIGKATALELARRGAHVVLASRNMAKAESARLDIMRATNNPAIECLSLDLASMRSVRHFVETFTKRFNQLHILINNAGIFSRHRALTSDGFELHFGVMYLGHFLLTRLLTPHLRRGAPARVVNVSAWGHHFGALDFDNLRAEKSFAPLSAYVQAKLAQVIFTQSFAQRMHGTGVTAYSLHPGMINTNLGQDLPNALRVVAGRALATPYQGASTSVYLATAPQIEQYSGGYFSYRTFLRSYTKTPTKTSQLTRDVALAQKLWHISEHVCREDTWVH
jgi:NAD(P)-dependent dehydrogenase (short-subunit alcohol dehydrogenase family)